MPAVANLVGSLAGVLGAEDNGVVAIVFGYPGDIEQEAEREGGGGGDGSETWSIVGGRRGDLVQWGGGSKCGPLLFHVRARQRRRGETRERKGCR
jgi:hypothetical protein